MNKFGKLINHNTLQFERILPGTKEQVWEYLVDDHKRSLWFAGGPTDLVPKGRMELIFNNSQFSDEPEPVPEKYKKYGDGYKSYATIVEVKAPELLIIQWEEGLVSFELSEHSEGSIKLILTHEKLPQEKDAKIGTLAGWHGHLDILDHRLKGNKVNGYWSTHMKLEEEYEKMLEQK